MFAENQEVEVIKVDKLPGKEYAPKLVLGDKKQVKAICTDSKGNQHLDVGLRTELNYVTSHETGEELPKNLKVENGIQTITHWCHPSRFKAL